MADTVVVQSRFDSDSGLPEDDVVNTWHFRSAGVSIVDTDNVFDMLDDFYTAVPTGLSSPLSAEFSADLAGTGVHTMYNLSDPSPRVPVASRAINPFTPGATELPREVSLCLSYHAAPLSGAPQARRRGRVYLGPFNLDALDETTGRPTTGLILAARSAARDLLLAANASTNWQWVVYSPTADSHADVSAGWVDNEFDTMRKRGVAATVRGTWSTTSP